MANVGIYDMTDTWNAGGTTFTAIKMNVTDTSSAAGSLLMDLQVGGSSKFKVTKAGNVDLAGTLDVTGATTLDSTLTVSGDVSIADKIIHTGDTNTAIRFPAADTVTVETAGSERLRIDSSGNVGIGTTSPGSLLSVSGTGTGPKVNIDGYRIFEVSNTSSDRDIEIVFAPGNAGRNSALVEIIYAAASPGSLAWCGGRFTYHVEINGSVSLPTITELEDIGKEMSMAATSTGMTATFTPTFTYNPSNVRVLVRTVTSPPATVTSVTLV